MPLSPELAAKFKEKIKSLEETPIAAKTVIYSPPGVGKTTLAAIGPKPFIVNCESGVNALRKLKKYNHLLDIQTYKPDSYNELKDVYNYLKYEKHDRLHCVLDSITEIQKMSMDGILLSPDRDDKLDDDAATLQDYSKNTTQMRRLIRAFRDLPMHVTFTALDEDDKDDTGKIFVRPALTPKLAQDVLGYVDVVGYLFVANDEIGTRKLLTQPKSKFKAKDRFGKLGLGLSDTTMYHILNKLTDGQIAIPDWLPQILEEVKKNGESDVQPEGSEG